MPIKSAEELNKLTFTDPKIAAEYLSAVYGECVFDGEFDAFLVAIRDLIQANSSMSKVANSAGIARQSLYQMLSEEGNPRLDNFASLIKAMGLQLRFEPSETSQAA